MKNLIRFKDTTDIGDIVLIVAENPQMLSYGLVTDLIRDETKRDEWWHVTLQILAIPPQETTWILRTPQMTGEVFTMNGEKRFVKAVSFENDGKKVEQKKDKTRKKKPQLRVIK